MHLLNDLFSSESVITAIHESTRTHACAFLCLWRRRSACSFYVRTPAPASAATHTYIMVVSWMCSGEWHGREELLKVIIFVFFEQKKYSLSFLTLQLNHQCHMDYFNNVLTTFMGLEQGSSGQKALRFHQTFLNLCSEDERMSYRFGKTGWVINDSILIFGWSIPLIKTTLTVIFQLIHLKCTPSKSTVSLHSFLSAAPTIKKSYQKPMH